MTFNIGSQSNGIFNNVGGNQNIYGGQQTYAPAEQSIRELRAALDRHPLPPGPAAEARAAINEIDAAVQARPEPDRGRAAQALERLTRLLAGVGALAAAGASLIEPLRGLATWLGPVAAPIVTLLPH